MKTLVFVSKKEYKLPSRKGELIINIKDNPVIKEFNEKKEFEVEKEILTWFQKWALKKRFNGKNIRDLTVINNVCYWHFLENLIFQDMDLLGDLHSMHNILYKINLAEYILQKNNPDKVVVVKDSEDPFFEIIKRVCKGKGILVRIIKNDRLALKKERGKHESSKGLVLSALKARIIFRRIIGLLKKKETIKRKLLFISSDRFFGRTNSENKFLGPLCEFLEKRRISYGILEYDMPYMKSNFSSIIRRYLLDKNKNIFIGEFYNRKVIKRISKEYFELRALWDKLRKNKKFVDSFIYKISFFDLVAQRFDFCFEALSYYLADIVSVTREALAKIKPKLVIGNTEADFYVKSVICHSKRLKFDVITLQHAGISPKQTVMRHQPEKDYNKITSYAMPSVKCVKGPYYKKIMVEAANYPKERVVVTGDVISDALIRIKKNFKKERESFFEKYGLNNKKKLITIITGLVPWQEEYIREVLEVLKKRDDVQIVIKTHPLDQSNLVNNIANKIRDVVIVNRNINLYKLLCGSCLVISYPSWTLHETMILNIPVIMVDLGEKAYPELKSIENALPVAKNKEEINKYIKLILRDKSIEKNFYAEKKKFLFEQNFKIDGRASHRVFNIIKRFL